MQGFISFEFISTRKAPTHNCNKKKKNGFEEISHSCFPDWLRQTNREQMTVCCLGRCMMLIYYSARFVILHGGVRSIWLWKYFFLLLFLRWCPNLPVSKWESAPSCRKQFCSELLLKISVLSFPKRSSLNSPGNFICRCRVQAADSLRVSEIIWIGLSRTEKRSQFLLPHHDYRFVTPFSHQQLISPRNCFYYTPDVECPAVSA